jgi:hypothetical protein
MDAVEELREHLKQGIREMEAEGRFEDAMILLAQLDEIDARGRE